MRTRQAGKRGRDTAEVDTSMAMNPPDAKSLSMPHNTDVYPQTWGNIGQPDITTPIDPTDICSEAALQQMRELESIKWNGGDNFYDGPHDSFCFVCGSTMELFGCQTCENCYHAECMTPSLDPSDVPTFWFCPHCVEREWHIPPESPTSYFTPFSCPTQIDPPSNSTSNISQTASAVARSQSGYFSPNPIAQYPQTPKQSSDGNSEEARKRSKPSEANPISKTNQLDSHPSDTAPKRRKIGRPRKTTYSPPRYSPRKKSKYSAFSSEVDKALAVIHSELEAASHIGRSENNLQEKIQALEQQLRIQDGQLSLTTRELEFARKELSCARLKANCLESDKAQCKKQVAELKGMVEKKDAELNDWRKKLRSLVGNSLD